MSNDEYKSLILQWFDAVNKGDVPMLEKLADELFTPDFMEHDPRMPDFKSGSAGVKDFIHQIRKKYSGIRPTSTCNRRLRRRRAGQISWFLVYSSLVSGEWYV